MVREPLHLTAVPLLHRPLVPVVIAFVVTVNKQHRIRPALEPFNLFALVGQEAPWVAEVARHDEVIPGAEVFANLTIPAVDLIQVMAAVRVARHEDGHSSPFPFPHVLSKR